MTARTSRIAHRFASVAVSVKLQAGTPKRRASSAPTQAASSVGSIAVSPPLVMRRCDRVDPAAGECPAIAPVSPRQKST